MNDNALIDMMVYLVLERLRPRFGSLDEAVEWYASSPVPGFSDATAMSLVHSGRGGEVLDYVNAVDAGVWS